LAPLAGGAVHFCPFFSCCSYFLLVGFATHYYSWRIMQLILGLVGLLVFFLILFFLPETYHPNQRGVDNMDPSVLSKWRPVILNPLRPLWILRSPNLLLVVRILLYFCHFKVFIGTRLWLALLFCFLILVCDHGFIARYTAHVSFSITGTTCIYNCEFAQLNVALS
jgi:MFS family permease